MSRDVHPGYIIHDTGRDNSDYSDDSVSCIMIIGIVVIRL